MTTLREYLLRGDVRADAQMIPTGVQSRCFTDAGSPVTIWAPQGIERKPSQNSGKVYKVLDVVNRASFNPNDLRATLVIEYQGDGKTVETYLDERFNDELVSIF